MRVSILHGDCRQRLAELPQQSVQTCVTSPPYFGLRDYGHDGQIGLEQTPDAFVAELVSVFREVKRVLRDDGTLWLNLGDSYSSGSAWTDKDDERFRDRFADITADHKPGRGAIGGITGKRADLPPKNLIGIPWRVAFALQADGWYLRQDIIWHKPNPMPESVKDRCTKAHEYIFLLTKSERYYYDADAIAEPAVYANTEQSFSTPYKNAGRGSGKTASGNEREGAPPVKIGDTRNRRSVWTVATRSFAGAHFATFPPDLIEPCILAGSKAGDTVLDPFGGAGTTGLVANRKGRNAILCELNPTYADMAAKRIYDDNPMFTDIETLAHSST